MNRIGVYDFEKGGFLFENAVVWLLKFFSCNNNPVHRFVLETFV